MTNILIVEDEEITAFALEIFCQKLGYNVIATVNNYEEALKIIHSDKPTLIISDIQLGEKRTGLDIAIKAEELYKIPTIFLTAYYSDEILKQAKSVNFHGYIIKPYKEAELEATLKLTLYQIEKSKKYEDRYFDICNHTFDMKSLLLFNDKEEIHLSKKSKRLLYYLINHLNEVKSYSEIIDYVYEGDNVSIDTLRHLVKRTRTIISKECIKAYRNIGYSLQLN